jgi:sorbitol-specific phosphotransferase system component IIA
MGIVFFCQSCGARFEVDPRMAGKKGHCKKCGQYMAIPRAAEIASMAAMPALAAASVKAGAAAGRGPGDGVGGASIGSMLRGGISNVGLAPLTVDRMGIGHWKPSKPSPLDDAEDSKPYALAKPVRENRGRVTAQSNFVMRFWRQGLGRIQKLFRKINQFAYLVSIPFLMILLFGAVIGNRSMAMFAATAVVLLNIGRLVAGGANLAIVPLRDGIDLHKLRKPLWRVIEPAVTIGLVVVAFTFIPSLSSGKSAKGSVAERIRAGAQALKQEMKGEVDKVVDVEKLGAQAQEKLKELGDKAKNFDIEKLGAQAQEKLKELGDKAKDFDVNKLGAQAQERPEGSGAPSSDVPAKKGSTGRIRSALEKRTQEELDKAKSIDEPRQ